MSYLVFLRLKQLALGVFVSGVLLAITGCASTSLGPDKPEAIELVSNPYVTNTNPTLAKWNHELQLYNAIPSVLSVSDHKRIRDQLIYATVAAINHNYDNYSEALLTEQAWTETALDIAIIGLGQAGALAGGAQTKAILAAITAGLAASHAAYVKNFFSEKGPQMAVSRMDALRKQQWSVIYAKLGAPDDGSTGAYSLSEASIDLLDYYKAGRVDTALNNINAESGATAAAAENDTRAIMAQRFGEPIVAAEDMPSETKLQKLVQKIENSPPTLSNSSGAKDIVLDSTSVTTVATSILKAYDPSIVLTGDPVEALAYYTSLKVSKKDAAKFLDAFDQTYKAQTK